MSCIKTIFLSLIAYVLLCMTDAHASAKGSIAVEGTKQKGGTQVAPSYKELQEFEKLQKKHAETLQSLVSQNDLSTLIESNEAAQKGAKELDAARKRETGGFYFSFGGSKQIEKDTADFKRLQELGQQLGRDPLVRTEKEAVNKKSIDLPSLETRLKSDDPGLSALYRPTTKEPVQSAGTKPAPQEQKRVIKQPTRDLLSDDYQIPASMPDASQMEQAKRQNELRQDINNALVKYRSQLDEQKKFHAFASSGATDAELVAGLLIDKKAALKNQPANKKLQLEVDELTKINNAQRTYANAGKTSVPSQQPVQKQQQNFVVQVVRMETKVTDPIERLPNDSTNLSTLQEYYSHIRLYEEELASLKLQTAKDGQMHSDIGLLKRLIEQKEKDGDLSAARDLQSALQRAESIQQELYKNRTYITSLKVIGHLDAFQASLKTKIASSPVELAVPKIDLPLSSVRLRTQFTATPPSQEVASALRSYYTVSKPII